MARFKGSDLPGGRRTRILQEIAAGMPLSLSKLAGGAAGGIVRTDGATGDVELATVSDNSVIAKTSGVAQEVAGLAIADDAILAKAGTADIASMAAANNSALFKGTGDLGFGTAADNSCLFKKGASNPLDFYVAGNNSVLMKLGSAGELKFTAAAARRVLAMGSTGDLEFKSPAKFLAEVMDLATTGTSFPSTNLYDGRQFYRTDHYTNYYYDSGLAGWLSSQEHTLHGGENANETSYFDMIPFNAPYSATGTGWRFPYDVKPMWISTYIAGSSTCTVEVRDDGTGVSNANISYSAESGSKTAFFSSPGTVTAASNLTVAVSSGTAVFGGTGTFVLVGYRRFET